MSFFSRKVKLKISYKTLAKISKGRVIRYRFTVSAIISILISNGKEIVRIMSGKSSNVKSLIKDLIQPFLLNFWYGKRVIVGENAKYGNWLWINNSSRFLPEAVPG